MAIRIAVIGAGIMGADHAQIIANTLPGAQLQVVCDFFEDKAREVADNTGAKDIATDPIKVINRDDVDAVLIASPDQTHAELSLEAIKAGKPTLCEKPLASTSSDCLKVMDAEIKAGKQFIQVGFMRRFDPAYTQMKEKLNNGLLGDAIMMHNFHRNVEAPANFTGAMAITNSAPHEFDVSRFVLDTDFSSISVYQPTCIDTSKTGAPVFMVLETKTGQLVNIEVNNNASYGYDVRGELVGEKGSIFLNNPVYTNINSSLKAYDEYASDWRARFFEAYRLQNKAWLDFINTGKFSPIASNSWDGYCAAIIAEAGVKALDEGKKIDLEMIDCPSLYKR